MTVALLAAAARGGSTQCVVAVPAGEASFLPDLVFPFVKLFAAAGTATNTEMCFELLATLLTHWTRGWFERFPHPPLGVLNRLQVGLGSGGEHTYMETYRYKHTRASSGCLQQDKLRSADDASKGFQGHVM